MVSNQVSGQGHVPIICALLSALFKAHGNKTEHLMPILLVFGSSAVGSYRGRIHSDTRSSKKGCGVIPYEEGITGTTALSSILLTSLFCLSGTTWPMSMESCLSLEWHLHGLSLACCTELKAFSQLFNESTRFCVYIPPPLPLHHLPVPTPNSGTLAILAPASWWPPVFGSLQLASFMMFCFVGSAKL